VTGQITVRRKLNSLLRSQKKYTLGRFSPDSRCENQPKSLKVKFQLDFTAGIFIALWRVSWWVKINKSRQCIQSYGSALRCMPIVSVLSKSFKKGMTFKEHTWKHLKNLLILTSCLVVPPLRSVAPITSHLRHGNNAARYSHDPTSHTSIVIHRNINVQTCSQLIIVHYLLPYYSFLYFIWCSFLVGH